MSLRVPLIAASLVACAQTGADDGATTAGEAGGELGLAVGGLHTGPRTIPYGGYVDFDGEPVNASGVKFNFALFPCATPGTGAGQCAPLWVAVGTWTNAANWTTGWPANASVPLPIFAGRFTVELGAAGQAALPDAVFADESSFLYLGIQIEGKALTTLQKIAPSFRAIMAAEGDRLRVRDAVELDDPEGGSATLHADDGLVVSHSEDAPARLLAVGDGAAPPLVVTPSGATVTGTLSVMGDLKFADGVSKTRGSVEAAGMVRAEGGTLLGDQAVFLSIPLDLTGKAGRWLHAFGGTSIAEETNCGNGSIVRVVLDNGAGLTTTISAQRHGAQHGFIGRDYLIGLHAQGYFQIPAEYAVAGAALKLTGGIEGGCPVIWGKQPSYLNWDGENAGATLGYAIF